MRAGSSRSRSSSPDESPFSSPATRSSWFARTISSVACRTEAAIARSAASFTAVVAVASTDEASRAATSLSVRVGADAVSGMARF